MTLDDLVGLIEQGSDIIDKLLEIKKHLGYNPNVDVIEGDLWLGPTALLKIVKRRHAVTGRNLRDKLDRMSEEELEQ